MCLRSLGLGRVIFIAYLFLHDEIEAGVNGGPSGTINEGKSALNLNTLTLSDKKKFVDSFDTIIADCDGVLYDEKGAIKDANRTVDKLRKQGKNIYCVYNTRDTTAQLMNRFEEFGFTNITEDSIISGGSVLVKYLQARLPSGKAVYVIGPTFFCDELQNYGIPCFGPGKDEMDEYHVYNIVSTDIEMRDEVGAVVVGFDVHFSYVKVLKAFTYLQNKGCLYIAMNTDETFISQVGTLLPCTGVIVAAIKAASGREPFNMGTPGNYLIETLRNLNDPAGTLYISNKLKANIFVGLALGYACSFKTLFILNEHNSWEDVETCMRSENREERMMYVPDYYTKYFSDLLLE